MERPKSIARSKNWKAASTRSKKLKVWGQGGGPPVLTVCLCILYFSCTSKCGRSSYVKTGM